MDKPPQPTFEEALVDLGALLVAIQPYCEELVLCGGFAAWLYRAHPDFADPHGAHQITLDIDWAVPPKLPMHGELLSTLLKEQDFVPIHFRGDEPPVIKYQHRRWGTADPEPICVEFLAPLRGEGRSEVATKVQPGVHATLLRYMDLALDRPISIDAHVVRELGVPPGTVVRLPHPANYLLHKALTAPLRRHVAKRNKDLAYLFDVAVLSRPLWHEMRQRVSSFEAEAERAAWLGRARKDSEAWFRDARALGSLAAADVLTASDPSRPVAPETVHRVMTTALPQTGLWPHSSSL